MLDSEKFLELKASANLPSPKGTALKLIELCQRENVTLPQLITVLQTDPATVGRILKLANSASFARTRPAASLSPDILMSIGIQAIRLLVLSFSLIAENRKGECQGFDYTHFWIRSVMTGAGTQLLGSCARLAPPAELFTLGLLVHIGQLAMATVFPREYAELIGKFDQFSREVSAPEEQSFGFTHIEVSAAMIQEWGLPKLFTDVVRFHENPENSGEGGRKVRLMNCLDLAQKLTGISFLSDEEREVEFVGLKLLGERAGISEDQLLELADRMLVESKEWCSILEMPLDQLPKFSSFSGSPSPGKTDSVGMSRPVLVVGEHSDWRTTLLDLLGKLGYSAHPSSMGDAALVNAEILDPEIVLIELEGHEGLRTISRLRDAGNGGLCYIIAVCGDCEENILSAALQRGMDDYLREPVEERTLLARLAAGHRIVSKQRLLMQEHADLQKMKSRFSKFAKGDSSVLLFDPLTGFYNRSYAIDRLKQEWSAVLRSFRPLSILLLEIDQFASVYELRGKEIADALLLHFSAVIRASARLADIPCLYAEGIFLLILPGTGIEGTVRLGERILASASESVLKVSNQRLEIGASIGAAEKSEGHHSFYALINAAENALELAKSKGRNQVIPAES
ncbi:MAG: HDOD domain-containing protein [Burkholderiales bacterium]|nr:HDOD domain-containing protein [Burkholderiales bacterium]